MLYGTLVVTLWEMLWRLTNCHFFIITITAKQNCLPMLLLKLVMLVMNECLVRCVQDINESMVKCRDSMRCQICADADVDTAFVPCGHVVCCGSCAPRLDLCPLCKLVITHRLKVFLPCQRQQ